MSGFFTQRIHVLRIGRRNIGFEGEEVSRSLFLFTSADLECGLQANGPIFRQFGFQLTCVTLKLVLRDVFLATKSVNLFAAAEPGLEQSEKFLRIRK